jgi:hypothetical protein
MASIESRLRGIASNATNCGACQMGAEIAREALPLFQRFDVALVCKRCGAFAVDERCPNCDSRACPDCD